MPETLEQRLERRSSSRTLSLEDRLSARVKTKAEPSGLAGTWEDVKHAVTNPLETLKGMATGVRDDFGSAFSAPVQGSRRAESDYLRGKGIDPRPDIPYGAKITKETRGSVDPAEMRRAGVRTGANIALAAAPVLGLGTRTGINAGLGAMSSPDDMVRGAATNVVLGEAIFGASKAPKLIKQGVSKVLGRKLPEPKAVDPTVAPKTLVEEPPVIAEPKSLESRIEARVVQKAPKVDTLKNLSDEHLETELRRLTEVNAAEEALHASVTEAGYRSTYEELPRTERLGRKGQEDLPDADGMMDSDKLAEDNKIVSDYNKGATARNARAKEMKRIEAELANRGTAKEPQLTEWWDDEPAPAKQPETPTMERDPGLEPDTSFDFGANAPESIAPEVAPRTEVQSPDPHKQPREYLNYARTGLDQVAVARVRDIVEKGRAEGTIDKGYRSFDEADIGAIAAKRDLLKQLVEDPNTLVGVDKLKDISTDQIKAIWSIAGDNTKTIEAASRVMNDPKSTAAEITNATELHDRAFKQTEELISTIVTETAQKAREFGALRNIAKQSTDPEVWLVQAKRVLGDRPLSDAVQSNIRRLAREVATACQ